MNVKIVVVCTRIADAQRWLLPGGSVVTAQEYVSHDRRTHRSMHVIVSVSLLLFLASNIVALHVTTRPKFELWLTGCEPWQTNTPQYAWRSVPENVKRSIKLFFGIFHVTCSTWVVALYELCGWYDATHRLRNSQWELPHRTANHRTAAVPQS